MVILQLFSVLPPRELADEVARAFGLRDLEDATPFSRADIVSRGTVPALHALRPKLYQVYIPCKASVYVAEDITPERCLVILRHFLRAAGMHLSAADMNFDGVRTQVYRIRKAGDGVVKLTRGSSVV
jgi:hypothetical protein